MHRHPLPIDKLKRIKNNKYNQLKIHTNNNFTKKKILVINQRSTSTPLVIATHRDSATYEDIKSIR